MTQSVETDRFRADAMRHYAKWYDRHAEQEQIQVEKGDYVEANRHHEAARIAVAAFKDEADHRDTPGLDS